MAVTLDRRDAWTAIPQLEQRLKSLELGEAIWAYCNTITETTISAINTETKLPIEEITAARGDAIKYTSDGKGLKITIGGDYFVSCAASCDSATSGDLMGIEIHKNDTRAIGTVYTRMGGNYDTIVIAPTPITLKDGDILTVYGKNNTAARGTFSHLRFLLQKVEAKPAKGSSLTSKGTSNYNDLSNKPEINSTVLQGNMSASALGLQNALVSGENIKTINNNSLLGSGNLTIQTGITDVSGTAPISVSGNDTKTVSISAASGTAAGSMSSSHYTKLEGIESGAEVNQNAFSNITVGSSTISADSATDTFELEAGSNITLTADTANDKVTIDASVTSYGSGTASDLETGTSTTDKVWQPKILSDYVGDSVADLAKGNSRIFYGVCTSGGSITNKKVTCDEYDGYQAGDIIVVKFNNTNTASSGISLDINSHGAATVKQLQNGSLANLVSAGSLRNTQVFVYDADYPCLILQGANEGGGDTVTYTQTQTTGDELGTITINGVGTKIYGVDYSGKQEALVSGTNIKTINNNSLLGSGDLSIGGSSKWAYCDGLTATTISTTSSPKKLPITGITESSGEGAITYDSTNKQLKLTEAGTYLVSCECGCNTVTEKDLMGIQFYVNGTSTGSIEYHRVMGAYDRIVYAPTPFTVTANSTLTLYGRNNTSGRGTFNTLRLFVQKL